MLADVIIHYDGLTYEFDNLCSDSSQPLYIRQAADHARVVLNKYYQKTDESELYRLALHKYQSSFIFSA